MLRLPLTASQWLVTLMGLGSSAVGNVCGVGEAWEGVGARDSRARALVSKTTLTRDPAILTGMSTILQSLGQIALVHARRRPGRPRSEEIIRGPRRREPRPTDS